MYEDDGGEKFRFIFNLYRPPKFLQLTQITLLLIILIQSVGLIKDKMQCRFKPCVEKLRKMLIVNCLGMCSVVFFGFWGLYFYDKKLIILKEMSDMGYKPPLSKNLTEHIFPFLFILFEFFIEDVNMLCGVMLIPFSILYYFISFCYYNKLGRWQYGLLNEIKSISRILVFAEFTIFALISIVIVYMIKLKLKSLKARNVKID